MLDNINLVHIPTAGEVSSNIVGLPGGVIPERNFRRDYMSVDEKELVKLIPSMKPYSHIFYTDPASVADLRDDWLVSKLWRMNNLFKVKTKSTEEFGDDESLVVDFRMKRQQIILYAQLCVHPRVVVLKSRQIGISTATVLMYFDDMLTREQLAVGIVAQNQDAANGLKDKASFAYENIDREILDFLGVRRTHNNTSEMGLSNGSSLEARLSFRSGTLHRFAWTEVGKIANNDPQRITETLSGSLQAIAPTKDNWIVNESTAEGDNYFKRLYYGAVDSVGTPVSNKEVRPLFFSWLMDKTCNSDSLVEITDTVQGVVDTIEKEYTKYIHTDEYKTQLGNVLYEEGFEYKITISQKAWMVGALKELDYDLELFFREYPHTPESAFYISNDGVWYKDALALMRDEGRLIESDVNAGVSSLYDSSYEVLAVTDIGYKDRFFIIYCHIIPTGLYDRHGLERLDIRILGCDYGTDMKTDAYAEMMWDKPYDIDLVVLPHDGGRQSVLKDSHSVEQDFIDMGFNTLVTAVTRSKVSDILATRKALKTTRIDITYADELYTNLLNYKKKYNKVLKQYESEPVHDIHSHGADTMRYVATCDVVSGRKSSLPASYGGSSSNLLSSKGRSGSHGRFSI